MKILHITPTLYPAIGGMETVVRELMLNLRRRGMEADAMHIAPGNRQHKEQLDDSILWRVPLFPHRLIGITPPLRSILDQYDILHLHDPQLMALSANILMRSHGKKIVLSTHGGYGHTSQHTLVKKLHWKFLSSTALNRYDSILASSQSDYERFKTKASHTRLVPNGVNVEKFLAIDRSNQPNPTRWIYWGRLSRNKRLDIAIHLVAQAKNHGLSIDLLLCGSDFDNLAPSLAALIQQHGLEDQVRLAGALSDAELKQEIATRSVYITASEYEGFGLSIIEAMAAGLIVICRNIAPLNGFITPGSNGILLQFDSSNSDRSMIQQLCTSSPEELAQIQRQARHAANAHSWKSAIQPYIDIYQKLAVGK